MIGAMFTGKANCFFAVAGIDLVANRKRKSEKVQKRKNAKSNAQREQRRDEDFECAANEATCFACDVLAAKICVKKEKAVAPIMDATAIFCGSARVVAASLPATKRFSSMMSLCVKCAMR